MLTQNQQSKCWVILTSQSNPYQVSEVVKPYTLILQVLATYTDFANNWEMSYTFTEETRKLLFNIDPHHGWRSTIGRA